MVPNSQFSPNGLLFPMYMENSRYYNDSIFVDFLFMLLSFSYLRTTISIYKMIEDIITLTKESEYKSREVAAEKRKGDMLLYDVSKLVALEYWQLNRDFSW